MNITIPNNVLQLLEEAMNAPAEAITPTFGGYSNLSFFATFDGMRCAVKVARSPIKQADVRREARVLQILGETPIPAPVLLRVIKHDPWTIAVTKAQNGRNGLRVLAETPAELEPLFAALGSALGQVHTTTIQPDSDLLLYKRVEKSFKLLTITPIANELRDTLSSSLQHPIWQTNTPRLVHGDIGLHNVLWSHDSLLLLDWEWASVGTPLLDLAWLRWTMHWRSLDDSLWHVALNQYQQVAGMLAPVSGEAVRSFMLGQIAMILTRVRDQPAALAEWIRRAEWTLALPETAFDVFTQTANGRCE